MILSIASGKGGTGKTMVAVNLALALTGRGAGPGKDPVRVTLIDADVEEPNAHIFLETDWDGREAVTIPVPEVDKGGCTHCGRCADICAYSAITVVREAVLVFPELCHGCGGCALLCPEGATTEVHRPIGTVEWGRVRAGTWISLPWWP